MKRRSRLAGLLLLIACGRSAALAPSPPAGAASPPVAGVPAASTAAASASADAGAATASTQAGASPAQLASTSVPLPGAVAPVTVDYIVYEQGHARVWVPVGDTGSVDVLDVGNAGQNGATSFLRVDGFPNVARDVRGRKRVMGPSAAAVGDGFVYIGNRATSEVCPIDAARLKVGACLKLPSASDGVAYVASTREVWVTMPHDDSIAVLDAVAPARLKMKTIIKLAGAPEGYAVDEPRGLFFTNLEDKDKTISIDVKTHEPRDDWQAQCGAKGPRGLALDTSHGLVFVACTDRFVVLDAAHGGALLGALAAGDGVDNIDWYASGRLLYVAAAKTAELVVARIDAEGRPTLVAVAKTGEGARNAVVDASGRAYLPDPERARVLVFPPIP